MIALSERTLFFVALCIVGVLVLLAGIAHVAQAPEVPQTGVPATAVTLTCTNGYTAQAVYRSPDAGGVMRELVLTTTHAEGTVSYDMVSAMAASGAKYATKDASVAWWEHQGEFRLFHGEEEVAVCREVSEDESDVQDAQGATMTETEARTIAESSCVKGGEALDAGVYDARTKSWRYAANVNATKPDCTPWCVVDEETQTANIEWECEKPADTVEDDTSGGTVTSDMLVGKTWVLVSATTPHGEAMRNERGAYSLTFGADGQVSIGTDCNGMGGTYAVSAGGSLAITDMMSTLMYCEGSQEGDFSALLGAVEGYRVTSDGVLVLLLGDSVEEMRFK